MLTIKVNGNEEKLNIGCRTFIALDELLKILEVNNLKVTLNEELIRSNDFGKITVKGGDTLGLT